MKRILNCIILSSVLALSSCNDHPKDTTMNEITSNNNLVGKKLKITYPDFTAEVNYLSDTALHWKTISNNGEISEGDEEIVMKRLRDDLYFVNWIEQDGLTISQVVDLEEKKVEVFCSFHNDNSPRGKRSSSTFVGSLEILPQ